MKKKVIICDICGDDITDSDLRFRFKEYGKVSSIFYECKYKEKLDMCEWCYKRLCRFVSEEKQK